MSRLLPLLLLCLATLARAHGLEPGVLGMQLEGKRLLLVVTPPVAALAGFDRDHDGRLSIDELQRQRAAIARDLDARLRLRDEGGQPPELTLADVIVPSQDKAQAPFPAMHVKILRRYRFAAVPHSISLQTDLAARAGMPLVVMFKAEGVALQSSVLASSQDRVRFSAVGGRAGGGQVLLQWWRIGIAHILQGSDHLLFLLLLAWGTTRWREAALWLTAFTLGHSLTLLLVLSGAVLFPAWAEAAIAATIVVTGLERLHRLLYPRPAAAGAGHWQAWLAAGFGLVHGLGFAGAVRDTALASAQRWPTLLGFNLGIETGQLLVALALWPLLRRLRQGPEWLAAPVLAGATSLGLVWLVARL